MTCNQSVTIDKKYYDEKVYPDSFFIESYNNLNNKIFKQTSSEMTTRLANKHCKVLELGAGMCWTSLMASKLPFVEEIHCMDISTKRMQKYVPIVNQYIEGNLSKLVFTEADFNEPLQYPDCSFDVVLFDAALHHSRRIWETLAETYRVLKPSGYVFAQREGILSIFYRREIMDLLKKDEIAYKVSENLYLREQYEYYLRLAGFANVEYSPVYMNKKQRLLWFTNGILFNNWVIIAQK